MKMTTNLEGIKGAISACLRCGDCTYGPWPENYTFCPLYERGKTFTSTAGGLLYLAKAILNQQMEYNSSLADLAFTCAACRACDGKCVIVRSINPEMALSDIIRLLRYELVKRGLLPEGPIKKMHQQVIKNGDLLEDGRVSALKIPENVRNDKANMLLIVDCMHNKNVLQSFQAAVGLLEKMEKQVAVFSDSGCCGSTLYDFGFWDQLPALVETKWKRIRDFGRKELLFVDPHCQEFMTKKYEKIIDGFSGFKGQHFSELLLDAFSKGKLKSKKGKKVKVSFHDPCFLGRGLGIYDAPRSVLGYLDGVQLLEMTRNREQSFCCGGRALGNYYTDFSQETARERIKEFSETNAEFLITACPYCKDIFAKVMGKNAHRVKDLIEFVSERVE
jgi:Fe-S oxidoreductase